MTKSIRSLLFVHFIIFIGCTTPDDKTPLQSITPESQGISSKAILAFIDAVETERPDDLHSLIILRHGQKIAEGYWSPYNPESPHMLFSLSKSFTSSAIGIAQDEGLLSIDDLVLSFFPDEAPDSVSNNLKAMRIRDLLKMNTGHNQDATGSMRPNSTSWAEGFLALTVEHKPGTHFVYNSAATYMLSAIIQKVTGETLLQFLAPRLFEPLEISNPTWDTDSQGINVGGWGLNVRTKDIANLGQLYLQKGNWNDKQLISEEWVDEATSFQTSNGSNPESDWEQGYGYQFWQCKHDVYRGDGAFGQYCIVIPQHNAVIAITSGTNDMHAILNLVWDHLLPAFLEKALPKDEENYQALENKLSDMSLSTIAGEVSSPTAETISNKSYTMEANETKILSMLFELTGPEYSITFTSEEESLKIPIGNGSMKKGQMLFPRYGKQSVSSTGAWTSDNTYQVRMYYFETPFYITYDFTFEDDQLDVNSEMNVGFGSREFIQLKGAIK